MCLVIDLAYSQNQLVKVTYNDKTLYFYLTQLNVKNLFTTFNISDIYCLEDLSGLEFFPLTDGTYPYFISSEVYVRQSLPKQVPTMIYPSESKFVYSTGTWNNIYELMIGRSFEGKNIRIGFIHFKDLSQINLKRKILKIYLRMVGTVHESILPSQFYIHRCESDWENLINWNQQPVYKKEPYTSLILGEVLEKSFYWDITNIVEDWVKGTLPNYGIAIKTNNSFAVQTNKQFHNFDSIKRPCLLVFYSN